MTKPGRDVPNMFTLGGQLETEIKALTKYAIMV